MILLPKLKNKLKGIAKPTLLVYPLIIIVAIPALLIINTLWNLRSFNRDVNFVIRHQAVSIADTLKPFIISDIYNPQSLEQTTKRVVNENEDILTASVIAKVGESYQVVATSNIEKDILELSDTSLNQFATSLNQPFAGLIYDPKLMKNVWNVSVPLNIEGFPDHLLALKLSTQTVDEILGRTSKDSLIILSVTIIITLILLTNHFIFYKKSLKTQQLEELDRLKGEFISMASHELRAPVTALVGYLGLLKDKLPKETLPTIQEDLNILNSLTRDLNNLINELLEVSRIEQGRLKIEVKDVNVNEIVKTVVANFEPLAKNKGLVISYLPVDLPIIKTDPSRVQQILTNLISNAVKYSLKGQISIESKVKDKFIEITVKDSGVGIPPEQIGKLFGKFHRVKDEKTMDERGTGLGLWITKQLVERLGGKIYAESIYGTGSSFTFTLPVVKTGN